MFEDPSGHFSITKWVTDKVSDVANKVSETYTAVKEKVVDVYNDVKDFVEEKVEQAKEFAQDVECKATIAAEVAKHKVTQAVNTATTWVKDHSGEILTVVGAGAAIIGASALTVMCPALAPLASAAISGGMDVMGQIMSGVPANQIDWVSVGLNAASGAITGALTMVGAGPLAMSVSGAITGAGMDIYSQIKNGGEINWAQVAISAAGGAASGAIAGKIGNIRKDVCNGIRVEDQANKLMSKLDLLDYGITFVENTAHGMAGGNSFIDSMASSVQTTLFSATADVGISKLSRMTSSFCFVAGTQVLTPNGNVNIEDIEVGDTVIATNPDTGETTEKQVLNTFINETEELIHVWVDGEEIVTTPSHPFYVAEKGWTSAVDLKAGDQLQLVNGEYVIVEAVQHEILEEPVKVYNFEVEDFHTYYVGTDVSVLVHNQCGETSATKMGKKVHKERADQRREGNYDLSNRTFVDSDGNQISNPLTNNSEYTTINQKLVDSDGNTIKVHRSISKKKKIKSPIKQSSIPDAIKDGYIIDDKPARRPISKDYQELGRNVEAYRKAHGKDPKGVIIDRYDPKTGGNGNIEVYKTSDFDREL